MNFQFYVDSLFLIPAQKQTRGFVAVYLWLLDWTEGFGLFCIFLKLPLFVRGYCLKKLCILWHIYVKSLRLKPYQSGLGLTALWRPALTGCSGKSAGPMRFNICRAETRKNNKRTRWPSAQDWRADLSPKSNLEDGGNPGLLMAGRARWRHWALLLTPPPFRSIFNIYRLEVHESGTADPFHRSYPLTLHRLSYGLARFGGIERSDLLS